jgi:glycine oxidase
MHHPDYCIAGAGIIGLSLALELRRRGATVTLFERHTPLAEASYAAAGMLAAHDPENPKQLQPLADLSLALYPKYLANIEALSQLPISYQTHVTLQSHTTQAPHSFHRLEEKSIDPRQLARSLLTAVHATTINLLSDMPVQSVIPQANSIQIQTPTTTLTASHFIDCTGSWSTITSHLPTFTVVPRKGQMLAVALPPGLHLDTVLRTPNIYIVPRTQGPNAGRAILGATIEDRGFDKSTNSADITHLHTLAAQRIPELASATILETWAGLRPATVDGLPLLGALPDNPRHLLATGHYRNGILLAPATAQLVVQLLLLESYSIDPLPYAPARIINPLEYKASNSISNRS